MVQPSFGVFDYCPSIAASVYGSVEFANANNNHRELMDLLENRTGMPINDIVMLNRVLDTLKIRVGVTVLLECMCCIVARNVRRVAITIVGEK